MESLIHDRDNLPVGAASVVQIILHAEQEGLRDQQEEILTRLLKGVKEQVGVA